MISSSQNDKLKQIRKLHQRKHRERFGLFVAEGEDLVKAARRAGAVPEELYSAAGSGLGGTEVDPDLLDSVSTLGSGTRVIGIFKTKMSPIGGPICVYLHGISDPGNVGAIIRTTHALVDGTVVLGPNCADPFSPKAVRASMGSIFAQPVTRAGIADTPAPRFVLTAHGGKPFEPPEPPLTICLGAEREGPPDEVLSNCEAELTIDQRPGAAESLNVAAAAAIALHRIGETAAHA